MAVHAQNFVATDARFSFKKRFLNFHHIDCQLEQLKKQEEYFLWKLVRLKTCVRNKKCPVFHCRGF